MDIPILRQLFGFFCLLLIPGFLILQLIGKNKISSVGVLVLSVGTSLSAIIFFGVCFNLIMIGLKFSTPLSAYPMLGLVNILIILLLAITGYVNKDEFITIPSLNLTSLEKSFLIIPILFPLLSILGTYFMNELNSNLVLLLLIILISIYIILISVFNSKFPKRIYPLVIWLIGISLLLIFSLRTENIIIGSDTGREYFFYHLSLINQNWNLFNYSVLNACLSVSVLPVIFQSILSIPEEYFFKIFFSIIFSISPIIIFLIAKTVLDDLYSFFASVFFMSQMTFLWTASQVRTNVAILFFALALFVLFNTDLSEINKRIFFIIFSFSIIVSHYSTTYLFLLILILSWTILQIYPIFESKIVMKFNLKNQNWVISDNKLISISMILAYISVLFYWYSLTTEAAFDCGVGFSIKTIDNLNNLLLFESRSTSLPRILGENLIYGIPHKIHIIFNWFTWIFIGLGLLYLLLLFLNKTSLKTDAIKIKRIDLTQFTIMLLCGSFLILTIILPFVSVGYDMQRLYLMMTVTLSTCFVIGCIWVSQKVGIRPYVCVLIILVPYLLCTTGLMYQCFSISKELTLNSEGRNFERYIIHSGESGASQWIEDYSDPNKLVYSTPFGFEVLFSQGGIPESRLVNSLNADIKKIDSGYIFIRYENILKNSLSTKTTEGPTDKYLDVQMTKNKIYNSNHSNIYL